MTAQQQATYNAIQCPVGYVKQIADVDPSWAGPITAGMFCADVHGFRLDDLKDPQTAALSASYTQSNQIGLIALVAAAGAVIFLDGSAKLLAIPLALYGLTKRITGGF